MEHYTEYINSAQISQGCITNLATHNGVHWHVYTTHTPVNGIVESVYVRYELIH